jgi:hypothetical protein
MKKRTILLCSIMMMVSSMATASILTDDALTIGLWHMEDFTDDVSYIPLRTGHDIVPGRDGFTTPVIVPDGKYGSALSFDGDGNAAAWGTPNVMLDTYDSVEINLWAKLDTTNRADNQFLLRAAGQWELYYKGTGNELTFLMRDGGSYIGHAAIPNFSDYDNQWVNIVATYTNDLGISLSVDDVTSTSTASRAMKQANNFINIGGINDGTWSGMTGLLDEIKLTVPSIIFDLQETPEDGSTVLDSITALSWTLPDPNAGETVTCDVVFGTELSIIADPNLGDL